MRGYWQCPDRECCVCMEVQTETGIRVLRSCRHALCQECADKLVSGASDGSAVCPLCRAVFR